MAGRKRKRARPRTKRRRPSTRRRRNRSLSAPMATRKRRRRRTRSAAVPKRRRSRRRGMGAPRGLMGNLFSLAKPVLAGAAGGAAFAIGGTIVPQGPWRTGLGIGAAFLMNYMGMNNVGSGIAGAAAYEFTRNSFGLAELDEMENTDYVEPTILSDDYALSDDETIDDNGNVYALSDDGSNYEYVGTLQSAAEQGVMMSPVYVD